MISIRQFCGRWAIRKGFMPYFGFIIGCFSSSCDVLISAVISEARNLLVVAPTMSKRYSDSRLRAISPNNGVVVLVARGYGNRVHIFDLNTGRELRSFRTPFYVRCGAYSHDGDLLLEVVIGSVS